MLILTANDKKNAEHSAELKGFEVDFLAIEYFQINKAPRMQKLQGTWLD